MTPTATLTPVTSKVSTRFGFSVATDQAGDTVAVGAPCDFTAGVTLCGTVYVYQKPSGGWANNNENAQLTISGVATVGLSVAMDSAGQTIVAGEPGVNALNNTPGSAYVFVKPGCPSACGNWVTTSSASATLTPSTASNPINGDSFGYSVSISGDGTTVVAGTPNHGQCSPRPCTGPGAVYVFVNPSAPVGWTTGNETSILNASNGHDGDQFGDATSVDLHGMTIVVGAPLNPYSVTGSFPGAAYVFESGTQAQLLNAFSGTDIFGNSVVPQAHFSGGGPWSDGAGVAISSDGSTLTIGGLATIGTTADQQEIYVFQ